MFVPLGPLAGQLGPLDLAACLSTRLSHPAWSQSRSHTRFGPPGKENCVVAVLDLVQDDLLGMCGRFGSEVVSTV